MGIIALDDQVDLSSERTKDAAVSAESEAARVMREIAVWTEAEAKVSLITAQMGVASRRAPRFSTDVRWSWAEQRRLFEGVEAPPGAVQATGSQGCCTSGDRG